MLQLKIFRAGVKITTMLDRLEVWGKVSDRAGLWGKLRIMEEIPIRL